MSDVSEVGVSGALMMLGGFAFWGSVAYFGFIRRIEKREEKQDQQRVNRIGQLASSVPDDYRNELVKAVREVHRGDVNISGLVSRFPNEYQSDIAITLAEASKVEHPYILEKFLRDYVT